MKDILAKKKSSGAKKQKKKWANTKTKEKLNSTVFWTKVMWDKVNKDIITKEAFITPGLIAEKLKLNVTLARQAIQELLATNKIVPYNNETHSRWGLFVKSDQFAKEVEAAKANETKDGKKDKKGKK